MRLQLGGDPLIDLLELRFEVADVSQSQVQDPLNRQGKRVIEGEAFGDSALKLTSILKRIGEVMPAEIIQLRGQILDRESRQLIKSRLLGKDQTAGDAKDVGEGFNTAIGAGFEEQEGGEVAFLARQVLDEVEAKTGVEAQRQTLRRRRPGRVWAQGAGALGDVEGVLLIALVILSKALLEPLDPAWIEEKQVQMAWREIRVRSELEEERQPQVPGGFSGDVQPIKGIGI